MNKEHILAEQAFSHAIGDELRKRVVVGPNALCLDGHFTTEQLRVIAAAYDQYVAQCNMSPNA
jgi:hypothetical protein